MSTFCNQCGNVELCEVCHDTFYDSHPFSTGDVASKVVSSIQQRSKQESKMADQVKKLETRFIHSNDRGVSLSPFGKVYLRKGWTCAFVEASPTKVVIGLAFCGENDVFSRRIGRMIAEGRMQKKPTIITKEETESAYAVAKEFSEEAYFEDQDEFDPVGSFELEAA